MVLNNVMVVALQVPLARFGATAKAASPHGPLAVMTAIAAGPLGWTGFGVGIAVTCMIQHRLVRDRLA